MLEAIDYAEIQNIVNLYPHVIDVPANYGRVADDLRRNLRVAQVVCLTT